MRRALVRLLPVAAVPAVAVLVAAAVLVPPVPSTSAAEGATSRWIVQLKPGASVSALADRAQGTLGVRATHRFGRVLNGFAATLTEGQRADLAADPRVAAIVRDQPIWSAGDPYPLTDDEIQPGITRVGATSNVDREGASLDVDIAVLDTGIQPDNDELNIHGGYNCTDPAQSEPERDDPNSWKDSPGFGHGTHVSGIAAARQNGRGVAGVAQGARLWAIKVLDGNGNGYWSWVICGLDHVAQMRAPSNTAVPRIEVVNMSIAGAGWDDGNCGLDNADLFHQAVCRLDAEGVTMVAAAGNSAADAGNYIPGAYDEVITVSAMADWNGAAHDSNSPPGTPPDDCPRDYEDDAFASFSNYGPDVDLIAPGVCVLSTLPFDELGLMSGTSMATPHVSGGAALYYLAEERLGRPRPTPHQVRAALIARGTLGWRVSTDRDLGRPGGEREPALRVNNFALAPDFEIGTSRYLVRVAPGGSAEVRVWIARLEGFPAAVGLSLNESALPPGASATFDDNPSALPADGTTLTLDLPGSAATGTYDLEITGQAGGDTSVAKLRLVVFATSGDSGGPWLRLRKDVQTGAVAVPVRVKWPQVARAQRYEVQASIDGGAWTPLGKTYATKFDSSARPGQRNRYRVRAKVGGTWRAWQTGLSSVAVPYAAIGDVVLTGSWNEASVPRAYSELPIYSNQSGARATLSFTGRSVSWIASRGPNRGKARISIDGSVVHTVDLYSGIASHRQVVFAYSWASAGNHTIRIEVLGTPSGRPRVDFDALVVIAE